MANEVVCFKALSAIHRMLLEGPQMAIVDTSHRINFIQSLKDNWKLQPERGYSAIIVSFVEFLENKVRFHQEHREIPQNFLVVAYQSAHPNITDVKAR